MGDMTVPSGPPGPSFSPYGAVDLGALAQAKQAKEQAAAARARASAAGTPATAMADVVFDTTDATFQDDVLQRSMQVPVVLDLWAEWCGPCKQLTPILEKLVVEDAGAWLLATIDVDANPQLQAALQVQSIPTVFVAWQGQVVPGFQGALPEAQVREFLDQVVAIGAQAGVQPGTRSDAQAGEAAPDGTADDPELTAADDALTRGDLDAAEAAYRQILVARPDHAEAQRALGSLTLLKRTSGLDPAAVMSAAASGDVTANCQAADLELLAGDLGAAFDRLVDLVRRTDGDDRDAAKSRLLELLDLVGNDVPEVLAARRALASALF